MMFDVNEVTIGTCDIHQIKENVEVKSNDMRQYAGP